MISATGRIASMRPRNLASLIRTGVLCPFLPLEHFHLLFPRVDLRRNHIHNFTDLQVLCTALSLGSHLCRQWELPKALWTMAACHATGVQYHHQCLHFSPHIRQKTPYGQSTRPRLSVCVEYMRKRLVSCIQLSILRRPSGTSICFGHSLEVRSRPV